MLSQVLVADVSHLEQSDFGSSSVYVVLFLELSFVNCLVERKALGDSVTSYGCVRVRHGLHCTLYQIL